MDVISTALKIWQKQNKITQDEMAETLGVSIPAVSQYIRGSRAFGREQAYKWAQAFGFDATFLMTGEGTLLKADKQQEQAQAADIVIPAALAQMFSDMAATIRSQQEQLREQAAAAAAPKNRVEDNQKKIG